jgi:hypothetical protein
VIDHEDSLTLRADLFLIAALFFLYQECYWAFGACALMFTWRTAQAAQYHYQGIEARGPDGGLSEAPPKGDP